ncbi:MAG: hypothetical protein EXQ52_00960 [Bryobacterales bacterium]|nr:hypothetical protein [Bryobacterales bacterium]
MTALALGLCGLALLRRRLIPDRSQQQ